MTGIVLSSEWLRGASVYMNCMTCLWRLSHAGGMGCVLHLHILTSEWLNSTHPLFGPSGVRPTSFLFYSDCICMVGCAHILWICIGDCSGQRILFRRFRGQFPCYEKIPSGHGWINVKSLNSPMYWMRIPTAFWCPQLCMTCTMI